MALSTPDVAEVAAELAAPGRVLTALCTPDAAESATELAAPGRLAIAPWTPDAADAASLAAASASVVTGAVMVLKEGRFWPVSAARQSVCSEHTPGTFKTRIMCHARCMYICRYMHLHHVQTHGFRL